jgi:hypothetical protein
VGKSSVFSFSSESYVGSNRFGCFAMQTNPVSLGVMDAIRGVRNEFNRCCQVSACERYLLDSQL